MVSCFYDKESHTVAFYYYRIGCDHWKGATGECAELILKALKWDKRIRTRPGISNRTK
jgi:hypothetical protein